MDSDFPVRGTSTGSVPESTPESREDRNVHAIEHDLELLEDEVKHAAATATRRIVPVVGAVLVLVSLAWLAGRRLRDRAERHG